MDQDRDRGESSATCAVAIVHYDALGDLERCLDSLARQTHRAARIRVYDVEIAGRDGPAACAELARAYPDVAWHHGANIGFAAAANRLIGLDESEPQPADVQLVLNADVALDPTHIARLLAVLAAEPDIAVAGGKLLRPGRALVDSAGIRMPAHGRPRDIGSERPDAPMWNVGCDVFAVSGAAMAVRTASLDRLRLCGELFDERFFMYHEDTDLCWRAARLGLRVRYVPEAVAVHRRGWRKAERFARPVWLRRHSFKNHYLQLIKNETGFGLLRRAPALGLWEVLRLGFAVLRDPRILPAYGQAVRAMPDAWGKRRELARRVQAP